MLDTHLSFKTTPLSDERVFVLLDAQTDLRGQEFSTGVTMTQNDWHRLKESANAMSDLPHMAEAYLASVLRAPIYGKDGRTFDVSMFLPGGCMYDAAREVARVAHHTEESSWSLSTAMQNAMMAVQPWSMSKHRGGESGPQRAR